MKKHKRFGFTVIELLIVVVVIGILVTITGLAYRATQNNAKDETTKANALVLQGAVEEYYSAKGQYFMPDGSGSGGVCSASSNMCIIEVNNSSFKKLVDEGFIKSIPRRGDDQNFTYAVSRSVSGGSGGHGYAIEADFIDDSRDCRLGKNMISSWFGGKADCKF